MNLSPENRIKVMGYYNSLVRQQRTLEGLTGSTISSGTFEVIEQVFYNLNPLVEFTLPHFNRHSLDGGGGVGEGVFFDRVGVLAWLAGAIGMLESIFENASDRDPVTERLDFSFIRDKSFRSIVERDFVEAQRAYIADCWKSVIILSGGVIETMLLDALLNEPRAVIAKAAPKEGDLNRWSLADLINVAVELKIVEPSVQGLANPVREYRNLVHPGVERRKGIKPDKLEAESGLNILRIIQRDLSRAAVP
jgi:hypothetical protein